jgi:hypothetical protein
MIRWRCCLDKAIIVALCLLQTASSSSNSWCGPSCVPLDGGEPFVNQAFQHRPSSLLAARRTRIPWLIPRGGGGSSTTRQHAGAFTSNRDESYYQLAQAIQDRVVAVAVDAGPSPPLPEIPKLVKALKSLSATQKSFKLLDGAAHEAYQRTHHHNDDDKNTMLDVKGRAQRSAARLSATAVALGACELIELVLDPTVSNNHANNNGTLVNRQVLLNVTMDGTALGGQVRVLVLHEANDSAGPAGERHGINMDDASSSSSSSSKDPTTTTTTTSHRDDDVQRGRLLVVIADTVPIGMALRLLAAPPRVVRLGQGPEVASVQPALHDVASSILRGHLEAILRSHPHVAAVHLCGHSLSAGIATTAAAILQGELPLLGDKKQKKKQRQKRRSKTTKVQPTNGENGLSNNSTVSKVDEKQEEEEAPLQGLCRRRVSAIALGGPPCFSANVAASYVTSILYGDDIICRTSPDSMSRLLDRTRRALQHSSFIGKRLNWLTDTASLAMTNLQSHARGSEGEEARLTIPGEAYLVRPRRLGGLCSIHEVFGRQNRQEALRASLLWQLNDILLSRSCWRHHQLESYIKGLDRVQLRGVGDDDEGDDTNTDDD